VNAPLRRVGIVVVVLFAALLANLNWVQFVKNDEYRTSPYNGRLLLSEYDRERGTIYAVGGETRLAVSEQVNGLLKYQRKYPKGEVYAPITGYKGVTLGSTGVERAVGDVLSGNDDRLFASRVWDMFTGRKTPGGSAYLTVDPKVQETAYNALVNNETKQGKHALSGAAVALDPRSGAILAEASFPTYDPNKVTVNDTQKATEEAKALEADKSKPLLNRATDELYAPGSTFKVIVASLALESGITPDTMLDTGSSYTPPTSGTPILNAPGDAPCNVEKVTLRDALTFSCNTTFARLGNKFGRDAIIAKAKAYGFEDGSVTLAGDKQRAIGVTASQLGTMSGKDGKEDPPSVAQSCIGQRDVRMTAMQGAMMAATVANGGGQLRPFLVGELKAPDLTSLETTAPRRLREPIKSDTAKQLKDMMVNVVNKGTGTAAHIDGATVGGKTGTAQNGEDNDDDHGWFIGFAESGGKQVAVAVFLEKAGKGGSAKATQIAGEIMRTALGMAK